MNKEKIKKYLDMDIDKLKKLNQDLWEEIKETDTIIKYRELEEL